MTNYLSLSHFLPSIFASNEVKQPKDRATNDRTTAKQRRRQMSKIFREFPGNAYKMDIIIFLVRMSEQHRANWNDK